jgi:antitoxin (DNA-binding transcriptional repressor) of toxin-antitoxin stability system
MRVAVTNAKGQLTDLIRRAEAGEEVVLTRHGPAVVRLEAIKAPIDRPARRRLLEEVQASAAAKATTGEPAARSQDFLYDEQGLPAMMAVDTSALMTIVLRVAEADRCKAALEEEPDLLISAGTVAEA